ncbi:MAG: lysophospholipase, partial [Deltaproteobacteria bacterium]|nr:lysophospholipase [Deltaproteobacteria bacterium]
ASDGVVLQYRIHAAPQPRPSVLFSHGFAEHGARYGHLVQALLPAGVSVMEWDQRGHGKSGGRRVFIEQFGQYIDDALLAIELAAKKLPAPLFVVGHSMGGLVTLALARQKPAAVKGWILSNPALKNAVVIPAWKEALARGASKLLPQLAVPSGIPPEHTSRDAAEVAAYDRDPLNSKVATARWYTEFVSMQAEICARPQAFAGMPALVLLGTGDRIIDPQATQAFVDQVGGDQLQLRIYPGHYHELFNEPEADRRQVFADLIAWIDKRLTAN